MKKLTWKQALPTLCLLLATAILLFCAVWSRPKPVLLESDHLRLLSVEIFSETEQYDEITFVTVPDGVSSNDNKDRILSAEQEAQIIHRLSQATCHREALFGPNWDSAGIIPDRPASPWTGLTMYLFFATDKDRPVCKDIVLGEFSAERSTITLPSITAGLVGQTLSAPIENGDQVTADILHILALE